MNDETGFIKRLDQLRGGLVLIDYLGLSQRLLESLAKEGLAPEEGVQEFTAVFQEISRQPRLWDREVKAFYDRAMGILGKSLDRTQVAPVVRLVRRLPNPIRAHDIKDYQLYLTRLCDLDSATNGGDSDETPLPTGTEVDLFMYGPAEFAKRKVTWSAETVPRIREARSKLYLDHLEERFRHGSRPVILRSDHEAYYKALTPEEKRLIATRDARYNGSWQTMSEDFLRAGYEMNEADRLFGLVRKLGEYERTNKTDLGLYKSSTIKPKDWSP